ncbi:acidic leucine-rich nuclear phosphoprotein 32 family member B-like [Helianthus annuus]|uniref:acidic leucine-rich nuclear phosphoprotein 32 family member B-like n=1 Tax=Helianthus annuus TaxID=4232 RepID=UPI000B9075D1|nr:acidic leucine-rich nuclear phosphoprotein 32 family member B-like [Helianthus annuus]
MYNYGRALQSAGVSGKSNVSQVCRHHHPLLLNLPTHQGKHHWFIPLCITWRPRASRRARLAQTGVSSSLTTPVARAEAPAAVHLTPDPIRIRRLEGDLQDALRRIRNLEEANKNFEEANERRDYQIGLINVNLNETTWRLHFLDQRVPPAPPAEPELEEKEPKEGPEEEPEEEPEKDPEEDPEEEEPDEVAAEDDDDDDGDDGDDGDDDDADMGDGEVDD